MAHTLIDELLARSFDSGGQLLVSEAELGTEFFDLSSGIAGELMQKLVNYGQSLAVVVSDPSQYSSSFQDLVLEHQHHPTIRFFTSKDAAKSWLAQ